MSLKMFIKLLVILLKLGYMPEIIYWNVTMYLLVENCLLALFYIACGYTAEHSFTCIISSNVSLCLMAFYSSRKLSSKVPSDRAYPTKIYFLKNHNKKVFSMYCDAFCEDSFPGISYLIDFIGTAHIGLCLWTPPVGSYHQAPYSVPWNLATLVARVAC